MAKYLNLDGLQTLWAKLKDTFALKKHSHTVEDIPVDSALSSTSENPVQNKVVNAALDGKVPTSRTINGKSLSANISLSASDVGATPFKSVTYYYDVSTDTEEWIRIGSISSGICSFSALMMLGSGPGNCFVDITASCMAGGWGSQKLRVNACSYVNGVALIKKVRLVVKGNATGYLEILKGKYSFALKKTITIQLDSNATGISLYSTPQTAGVPDGYSTLEKDSISDVWLKNLKDSVNIVNNLTSTSTNDALSAAQGKNLKDTKADAASVTGATKCKVTYNSQGVITSGADLAASDIPNLAASKITSGTFADERIASASKWNAKQDALAFDTTPTENSSNPVTSAGVKSYVDSAVTGLYKYRGSVNTAYINALQNPSNGDVYNINASGTITNGEGGQPMSVLAGDNVAFVLDPITSTTYWDKMSSELDLSNFVDFDDIATATTAGVVKSSSTNGKVSVDASGVMTVNGWNGKQDKLAVGSNISISGNTISATDTTYSEPDDDVLREIVDSLT